MTFIAGGPQGPPRACFNFDLPKASHPDGNDALVFSG
jgi:hypothetical protein